MLLEKLSIIEKFQIGKFPRTQNAEKINWQSANKYLILETFIIVNENHKAPLHFSIWDNNEHLMTQFLCILFIKKEHRNSITMTHPEVTSKVPFS